MTRFKLTAGILALMAVTGCSSVATHKNEKFYQNQEKISEYTQKGMDYYWHGGDLKKAEKEFFKGITLKGKYDVVENYFVEASNLNPSRLDLRFGIASSQILQGKTDEALDTYREIIKIYPDSFEANMLLAGYDYALGNMDEYNEIMNKMKSIYPEKTRNFEQRILRTEDFKKIQFNTYPFEMPGDNQAIVVLGYALGKDGVMQPTLIGRLEQALAMAKKNPNASIIVTGGVPQGGVTEAYLMKNWLVEKGINPNRIYIEDQAKDTVGNALYSVNILKNIGAKNVNLITSASHMRRALAVLQEMALTEGLQLSSLSNLVYLDYPSLQEAYSITPKENLVIYRDMMRAAGFWAYPGIQR